VARPVGFEYKARMDDVSILDTVARATRLREGPAGVAAVLRAVYRAGSLRLQDAAREARLPLPVTTAIRRELEKAGLLERKHGLALTETGRTFVEATLGLGVTHDASCPACGGRGIVITGALRGAVDRLAELIAHAPSVDVTLDQCPCEPETAILRALLMLETGALEGRRVLILGDDDSLSVAIGLVGRALKQGVLTRGVTVIESDPRRVAFLRDAAAREAIAIDAVEHDLRTPLPAELARAFDTAATDPPYTLSGATLFLGRAAAALKGDGACHFSFTRWPPAQLAELQRVILDLGLPDRSGLEVITEIRKRSPVPIIVLSARSDERAKVQALDLGADDYVAKPFGMGELTARLRAALRHAFQAQGELPVFSSGDLSVDLVRRHVTRDGREIKLSPKEFELLRHLVTHAGKVLTHRHLLREVWGPAQADEVQYLRVFIRGLRQKLEPNPTRPTHILTELGVGYRLQLPPEQRVA